MIPCAAEIRKAIPEITKARVRIPSGYGTLGGRQPTERLLQQNRHKADIGCDARECLLSGVKQTKRGAQ